MKRKQRFETFTFDEIVQYGKEHSDNIDPNSGIPWSFQFKGYQVTHETDNCYIILIYDPELPASLAPKRFIPGDVLVFGVQDLPYIIKSEDAKIGQPK